MDNAGKIIAAIFAIANNAIALAQSIRANSGLSDDELRAQVKSENQATRESIDAFLASLPKG